MINSLNFVSHIINYNSTVAFVYFLQSCGRALQVKIHTGLKQKVKLVDMFRLIKDSFGDKDTRNRRNLIVKNAFK